MAIEAGGRSKFGELDKPADSGKTSHELMGHKGIDAKAYPTLRFDARYGEPITLDSPDTADITSSKREKSIRENPFSTHPSENDGGDERAETDVKTAISVESDEEYQPEKSRILGKNEGMRDTVGAFLDKAGRYPRLSHEQRAAAFRAIGKDTLAKVREDSALLETFSEEERTAVLGLIDSSQSVPELIEKVSGKKSKVGENEALGTDDETPEIDIDTKAEKGGLLSSDKEVRKAQEHMLDEYTRVRTPMDHLYDSDVFLDLIPDNPDENEKYRNLFGESTSIQDLLIRSNLPLIHATAIRTHRELPLEDQLQAGYPGLVRGVEKYDVSKGFAFSTYATGWIDQSIQRSNYSEERNIRLPVHVEEHLNAIRNAEEKRKLEQGTGLSDAEIRDLLKEKQPRIGAQASDSIITVLREGTADTISTDILVGNDAGEGATLDDFIPDREIDIAESVSKKVDTDAVLRGVFGQLSEQEREILTKQYLEEDGVKDSAESLGLSEYSFRRIRNKTLEKLRNDPALQALYYGDDTYRSESAEPVQSAEVTKKPKPVKKVSSSEEVRARITERHQQIEALRLAHPGWGPTRIAQEIGGISGQMIRKDILDIDAAREQPFKPGNVQELTDTTKIVEGLRGNSEITDEQLQVRLRNIVGYEEFDQELSAEMIAAREGISREVATRYKDILKPSILQDQSVIDGHYDKDQLQTRREQSMLLHELGLKDREIARIQGLKNVQTVRMDWSRLRKQREAEQQTSNVITLFDATSDAEDKAPGRMVI